MNGKVIRERFLQFFKGQGHEVVPSSSLVPVGDPTLLFSNAGMNQFKSVFTGQETRSIRRAVSAQKCMRAGGKHNDLENVGRTVRHLTFFEMLGNFSFGDYFKKEAIEFAWSFVTRELGLETERITATVFRDDDEALALWRKHLPAERVVRLDEKDNFWAMGETGPCGPCSEIHLDRGEEYHGEAHVCEGVACDCDRFIELWNLVFMQYERAPDGTVKPLPKPSIDTGAGLERLAMVLQDKDSVFDTDLFAPIMAKAKALGASTDLAARVIADHARATAFLIADGVFPEKNGREYVLRRIMRRAVRHGAMAGIERPFLDGVCAEVVRTMREAYPELAEKEKLIVEVTRVEEGRFRETLTRGLNLIADWRARSEHRMPGDVVFKLYDTYGFPTDLVEVIGKEQGFEVDMEGFERAMNEQRARGDFRGAGGKAVHVIVEHSGCVFSGYDRLQDEGRVVYSALRDDLWDVVCDITPFYAESGGQVGDQGTMEGQDFRLAVLDTQRSAPNLILHRARLVDGRPPQVGDTVRMVVDSARRTQIRRNHSATHLLHYALRRVLGEQVMQKGSLVAPDRLRFDFSHFSPIKDDDVRAIEDLVNERIVDNAETETVEASFDEARKMGALAFFGDKYGNRVRVVRIGRDSLELCGGTHVARAGDIGLLAITMERGIAQGVRRVEAVTADGLMRWAREIRQAASRREEELLRQVKEREKEIEKARRKAVHEGGGDLVTQAREVGGVKVLAAEVAEGDPKVLREVGDRVREKLRSAVVVLAGVADGRVTLLAMVTPDLTSRFHAGKILGELAGILGGKGGGKPELAQGGGGDARRVSEALERVYHIVEA